MTNGGTEATVVCVDVSSAVVDVVDADGVEWSEDLQTALTLVADGRWELAEDCVDEHGVRLNARVAWSDHDVAELRRVCVCGVACVLCDDAGLVPAFPRAA